MELNKIIEVYKKFFFEGIRDGSIEGNEFSEVILNEEYKIKSSNIINIKEKNFLEITLKCRVKYLKTDNEVIDYTFDIYIIDKLNNKKINKKIFTAEILKFKLLYVDKNQFNLFGEILVRSN